LSFIHRGAEGSAQLAKAKALKSLETERPFRWATLTACRKKCAFLSGGCTGSQGRARQNREREAVYLPRAPDV
jgi:hypothetical protein